MYLKARIVRSFVITIRHIYVITKFDHRYNLRHILQLLLEFTTDATNQATVITIHEMFSNYDITTIHESTCAHSYCLMQRKTYTKKVTLGTIARSVEFTVTMVN